MRVCKECGLAFPFKALLNRHVNAVHRGIKAYKCKECDKEFSDSGNLKKHRMAVHLKIKDKICNDCGLAFSDNGSLKRHQKVRGASNLERYNICSPATSWSRSVSNASYESYECPLSYGVL